MPEACQAHLIEIAIFPNKRLVLSKILGGQQSLLRPKPTTSTKHTLNPIQLTWRYRKRICADMVKASHKRVCIPKQRQTSHLYVNLSNLLAPPVECSNMCCTAAGSHLNSELVVTLRLCSPTQQP